MKRHNSEAECFCFLLGSHCPNFALRNTPPVSSLYISNKMSSPENAGEPRMVFTRLITAKRLEGLKKYKPS